MNAAGAPDLNAAPARKGKKKFWVWFPMLYGLFGLFPLITLGNQLDNLGFHAVVRLSASAVGCVVFGVGLGLTLSKFLFRGE
jgi:hypothetical protein